MKLNPAYDTYADIVREAECRAYDSITHSPPSKIKPETTNFCLINICKSQIFLIGSERENTSIVIFGAEFPI